MLVLIIFSCSDGNAAKAIDVFTPLLVFEFLTLAKIDHLTNNRIQRLHS